MPNGDENNLSRGPSYRQEQSVIYLLELIANQAVNSSGANSKYPRPYDYILVTSSNGAGDPLTIAYKLAGVTQFTHTITYDGSGNFQSLTIA